MCKIVILRSFSKCNWTRVSQSRNIETRWILLDVGVRDDDDMIWSVYIREFATHCKFRKKNKLFKLCCSHKICNGLYLAFPWMISFVSQNIFLYFFTAIRSNKLLCRQLLFADYYLLIVMGVLWFLLIWQLYLLFNDVDLKNCRVNCFNR